MSAIQYTVYLKVLCINALNNSVSMLTNTRTSYHVVHHLYILLVCHLTLIHVMTECAEIAIAPKASAEHVYTTPSDKTQKSVPNATESSTELAPTAQSQEASQEAPKQKKRRRKRKSREKTAYITFNTMTYDQLVERKDILVNDDNRTMAIKYLKRILTLCTDANLLAGHMLQLADLLFENESYQKAVKVYREFISLYPGSKRIEYALYQAISASFKSTHSPDRDQTPTHETIELANTFLSRGDIFNTYATEVTTIRNECYKKLVESELNVCSFYRSRKQDEWVEKRIAFIEEDWGNTFEPTKTMIQAFRESGEMPIQPAAILEDTPGALRVTETEKPKVRMVDRF